MTTTNTVDLTTVDRIGPFDPELLVECALRELEDNVDAARAKLGTLFTEGGAVFRELFAADNAEVDAKDAIYRARDEALQQLKLLVDPDFDGDSQVIVDRIDQLTDQWKGLAASGTHLAEYHIAQAGRYTQLGKYLKQLIGIAPRVRREVRRARILSSLGRAGAVVAALGATVLIEMKLSGLAEELLGVLLPNYAKVIAGAVLYLLGLVAIDKPVHRWLQGINWQLFERIRAAQVHELKRIQEIESQLNALI